MQAIETLTPDETEGLRDAGTVVGEAAAILRLSAKPGDLIDAAATLAALAHDELERVSGECNHATASSAYAAFARALAVLNEVADDDCFDQAVWGAYRLFTSVEASLKDPDAKRRGAL